MIVRFLGLALCMLIGAGAGWVYGSDWTQVGGALVGAWFWLAIDTRRMRRVLQWLGDPVGTPAPNLMGAWGELADRGRKAYRQLLDQARHSEGRLTEFLAALQASPNGVMLLDADGRIEWCNLTVGDHLGIDSQRDIQQHVTNLVRDPLFTAYLSKGDFEHDVLLTTLGRASSQTKQIAVRLHPYGDGRTLMLSRDVTAVQQAEAMRRDFVANVSHEIRTPLTVLAGFVETLQTLSLEESERQQYLGLMAQQAQRMQSLVSDLLTLSKLEGSPAPSRREGTLVTQLIFRCVDDAKGLSEVLSGSPHVFDVRVDGDAWLAGSADELSSALGNLLSNAVRYTQGGGRIEVGFLRSADGGADLWVADSGPGIAAEHLPRLTERFYRVDRSRSRETGGTGLGLAIVKHVVQRHGGRIDIHSQLGKGARFTLHFPSDRVRDRA